MLDKQLKLDWFAPSSHSPYVNSFPNFVQCIISFPQFQDLSSWLLFEILIQEAVAVGRSFASIKGYHLDGNKEMLSMGVMNIAGSLTSCYVATGDFFC